MCGQVLRVIVATFNEDGLSLMEKKTRLALARVNSGRLEYIAVHFCTFVHSYAVHFIVQLRTL